MNSSLVENILMAMLSLLPPGQSKHSQTPIAYCDDKCQVNVLCNEEILECKKPKFDQYLFNEKVDYLVSTGVSLGDAQIFAKPLSFVKYESYEDGLARYKIIAQALANVSGQLTKSECLKTCSVDDCATKCKKAIWSGDQRSLAFFMATLIRYESEFRADIHGGMPPNGRGDCLWRYPNGRIAKPGTSGTFRDLQTCQSVCLGQVKRAAVRAYKLPYDHDDLVGLDLQSTERCLTVVGLNLIGARGYCSKAFPGADAAGGAFSLYGTGNSCKNVNLTNRAKTFWRIAYSKIALTDEVMGDMNNYRTHQLYDLLANSTDRIFRTPAFDLNEAVHVYNSSIVLSSR
jgi:hypothetical protein